MNTPFRKLIRIAIVLIALIIMFNFFGYYLVRSRSEQNEQMSAMVNFAARQRILSQTIMKDAVLLLSLSDKDRIQDGVRNSLKNDLIEFNNNNKFLRGEIKYPGTPAASNSSEVDAIISK